MKIHFLFILKKTGISIYSRKFTNEFDSLEINLITPFFSAIFSFSENILSKKTPEILEMSGLRFIFRVQEGLIFSILSDSSASLLFVTNRLSRIMDEFYDIYPDTNEIKDYQQLENPDFDNLVDSIITGKDELYLNETFYKKAIDIFKDLLFKDEHLGAALLTTKGNIIYTSLPNEILVNSLRELEIRFMVGALYLPESYYSLENEQKVFSKIVDIPWKLEPLIVVVLYDSFVPLGLAEMNLRKLINQITNII